MTQPNPIPALDPNPLPAPFWVFKLLLLVTFVLHILAMNALVGSVALALVGRWRGRKDKYGARLFADIVPKLPSLLAATITLGVAPLLFVQVLYGQFFYTSSILMGWPWFLLLVLLVVAYYGLYFAAARRQGLVLLGSTVLLAAIGFLWGTNTTLSQAPGAWAGKYSGSPAGWNLNLGDATLAPRLLHFAVAAVAVGGIVLALVALRKWASDEPYARYVLRLGAKAFLYATMGEFAIGVWFLASLPAAQRMLFADGNIMATAAMILGMVVAAGSILAMAAALRSENPRPAIYFAAGGTAVVVALMAVMRDALRDAYLQPYFRPDGFAAQTQWSTLPLFLALFVGGGALWFAMLKRYGLFTKAH